MIDKKVLVFLEKDKLSPAGGPYGYNYNLKEGLDEIGTSHSIEFINDNLEKSTRSGGILGKIKKKITLLKPYNDNVMDKYLVYDIVHFHTSLHMYKSRRFLRKYKGIVLFTTHSPMLLSREMREGASILSKIIFFWLYIHLKTVDKYAFRRADKIIFPCKEAEEPYYGERCYLEAKKLRKMVYMTTGVRDCQKEVKTEKNAFRKKYNIPESAFVFSYVGRHNKVKGYLDLKKSANYILQKYDNVYFIIGGNERPIRGLKNDRWIEIGFTNDPYSLINASDIFILPNKQTYFDLVFLEALSVNKNIIASYTGGNRYFKKFNSDSILLYYNDLSSIIESSINIKAKSSSRDIYLSEFTCKKFAERYLATIDGILVNKQEDSQP